MRFHLLFGSGALIVLGAAYLLGHEGTTPGVPVDTQGQRAEYGYVALDADVLQTSEQGTPLYTFSAARVEQKAGSGDIAASTVTMHYLGQASRPWVLSANEGQLPEGSSRISLSGNVQVRGKPPGSDVVAQINTQQLNYDTRSQDVDSQLPVSLSWSGQQLNGRGLTANLRQGHVRLESDVHGHFTP